MHEDDPTETSDDDQGGVFGKLPASRPGTRSPRRDGASGRRPASDARANPSEAEAPESVGAGAATTATGAQGAPAAGPPPRLDPAPDPLEAEEPALDEDERSGLEDLAWAGIAAAAEAATLGVRLAGRALGAVRDNVDRR